MARPPRGIVLLGATLAIFALSTAHGFRRFSSVALACSCNPQPPATAARELEALVFSGVVTAVTSSNEPGHLWDVTFAVERVYKGAMPPTVVAQTTAGAACGVGLVTPGERWLVYSGEESPIVLHLCSRTARVDEAAADLKALGPGYPPAPSSIVAPTASIVVRPEGGTSPAPPSSVGPAQDGRSSTCGRCASSPGAAGAGGWLFAAALAAGIIRRRSRD